MDSTGLAAKDDDQEQTSSTFVETKVTESSSSQWTDEKHSLYLDSMETTFVKQLYKSLNVFDRNPNPSGSKSSRNKKTGQFKVLREGHWSKLDFERDDASEAEQREDNHGTLMANPWIRHYSSRNKNPCRSNSEDSHAKTKSLETSAQNVRSWQEDSASNSNTEVMGQNFDDEEEKSVRIHEIKRSRTSNACVSGKDQLVPGGNVAAQEHDIPEEHHLHRS